MCSFLSSNLSNSLLLNVFYYTFHPWEIIDIWATKITVSKVLTCCISPCLSSFSQILRSLISIPSSSPVSSMASFHPNSFYYFNILGISYYFRLNSYYIRLLVSNITEHFLHATYFLWSFQVSAHLLLQKTQWSRHCYYLHFINDETVIDG